MIIENTDHLLTLHNWCAATSSCYQVHKVALRRRYATIVIDNLNLYWSQYPRTRRQDRCPATDGGEPCSRVTVSPKGDVDDPQIANGRGKGMSYHLVGSTSFGDTPPHAALIKHVVLYFGYSGRQYRQPWYPQPSIDPLSVLWGPGDFLKPIQEDFVQTVQTVLPLLIGLQTFELLGLQGTSNTVLKAIAENLPKSCHELKLLLSSSYFTEERTWFWNTLASFQLTRLEIDNLLLQDAPNVCILVAQQQQLHHLRLVRAGMKYDYRGTESFLCTLARILFPVTSPESGLPCSLRSLTLIDDLDSRAR